MLLSASFVCGLNNESDNSPFGFMKKVAGTAGGVWIPHISRGWVTNEGTSMLNFFAIGGFCFGVYLTKDPNEENDEFKSNN